ncbi:MAG: alpha/beta fold hydrolase [Candidatus Dormibacteraeota bacterium]|nr:alpha/beta fold hydrolase [Candidatus Dormibacteraeota bacterium]
MHQQCGDLQVAWREWGRGDPLVLVHGLADDHRAWRKTLAWLTLEHRVIAYDLRGHGETSLGQAEGSLAQLGHDLICLLDALELPRVALAGFSLGGTVVLRAAIDHPQRVSALLPIATSSRVGRLAADWYTERAQLADQGWETLAPALREDTRQQFAGAPAELEAHWRLRQQAVCDPAGFASACRAMAALRAQPLDGELSRIQAPLLVIAAAEDQLCPPRAAEAIQAGVPSARLAIIAGSGHQVEVEQPEQLSGAMLGFLAELRP